jgi:hypothetical protein
MLDPFRDAPNFVGRCHSNARAAESFVSHEPTECFIAEVFALRTRMFQSRADGSLLTGIYRGV